MWSDGEGFVVAGNVRVNMVQSIVSPGGCVDMLVRLLAWNKLGSEVALGPSWVPALFSFFLGRLHHLWWRLVQLVWLGGRKMLWAVIVSRSAAFNPIPVLRFPMLVNVFLS